MSAVLKLAVIDDDPTGAQSEAGVPLLLEWPRAQLRGRGAAGAVHLMTNSRALDERGAYAAVRDAAVAARDEMPERAIVLRGDSTLRGHLLPEYLALRDVAHGGRDVALLLVPALPAAGRVTVGGVHWLERDGVRTPIHATEYARDRRLGYARSRLLEWAQERSNGHFAAAAGRELPLAELRGAGGAAALAGALEEVDRRGLPAAVVPDAESAADLELIAAGLAIALHAGTAAIVRSGPAFVGVAAGTTATGAAEMPRARRGALVIVGSHVPATTRQLKVLAARRPGAFVEADAAALAGPRAASIVAAVAGAARQRLRDSGLAVVATTRATPPELLAAAPGMRIARGLAEVVAALRDDADVVIAKGGITSAVCVRDGFGAREAVVVGPVEDGVALWRVRARDAREAALVVVPGNVGDDGLLARLAERVQG